MSFINTKIKWENYKADTTLEWSSRGWPQYQFNLPLLTVPSSNCDFHDYVPFLKLAA